MRGCAPIRVAALVFTVVSSAAGRQAVVYPTPGDAPLCIASAADGALLVGYSSGRVVRLSFAGHAPRVTWEARTDGAVVGVLEVSRPQADQGQHAAGDGGAGQLGDILAATTTGRVVCWRGSGTEPAWQFASTCEVSSLAEVPGTGNNGPTVAIGGADQRVHLLSGSTGNELWTHLFESRGGNAYVTKVVCTPDQDNDGALDVAAWLWSGELAVLSGRTGDPLWRHRIGGGFTDALALAPDLNGDGHADLLTGGNDGTVRACSGRDGTVLWSGRLGRPVRDVVAWSSSASGPGACACTAGGEVACFDLRAAEVDTRPADGVAEPRWTADLGDVCRDVALIADLDRDETPDAVACAENGVVAAFSGRTGHVLSRWNAGDVVRAVCPIDAGTRPAVGVAGLAGVARLHLAAPGDPAVPVPPAAASATRPTSPSREPPHVDSRPPAETRPQATAPSSPADPRVVILLYHDVLPEPHYTYATSVEDFRAQMDLLVREKCVCVTLDQIADWIEGRAAIPDRAVCITFDGQYQGHHTYAFPILRERGLFATSYITTDWIGTANHADWHQLREMEAAGVMNIQNHTLNHPFLSRCEHAEVIRQLAGCNEAIRRHMNGKTVRHHTYPSGDHNEDVRRMVRESGFRTATTVRPAPVLRTDDLMALPRYTITKRTRLDELRTWLTGVAATFGDGDARVPPAGQP